MPPVVAACSGVSPRELPQSCLAISFLRYSILDGQLQYIYYLMPFLLNCRLATRIAFGPQGGDEVTSAYLIRSL